MTVRVQLCGAFVIEMDERQITSSVLSRQIRLLFAYLVLCRPHPVTRDTLVDALWGDAPPGSSGAALSVLISKLRSAIGSDLVQGRAEVSLVLPEGAEVDIEIALAELHSAESAAADSDWPRAWFSALSALFIARRPLLPDVASPWADAWRRRLADVHIRALECYAKTCLEMGGAELPGAERASRELVEVAPLRETGHLLLMRSLAAAGNTAEALAAYERLRTILRDQLGVSPGHDLQQAHQELLG